MADKQSPKHSRWVVRFSDGDETMRDLLGGKGAGLAGMTRSGLPVPPGFVITTEACRAYTADEKHFPDGLWEEALAAVNEVEKATGKTFGGLDDPLLFSVRSGAAVTMPGMMDTILNLGLNEKSVTGLASLTGDDLFAWDAYLRFLAMFGEIVFDVPSERFAMLSEVARSHRRGDALDVLTLRDLVVKVDGVILGHARRSVPYDAEQQLRLAIAAVFDSWMNDRAIEYRKVNGIPDHLGTAVTVQSMVFGNASTDSGTGVAFTRNPTTGAPELYGEYLADAQGEDVVAGIRTPQPISALTDAMPNVYAQLRDIATRLERHYRDMQDLEYTIERGQLWMLQTRKGKRSGRAAIRIAADFVQEGLLTKQEALTRVVPSDIEQLLHPVIAEAADVTVLATGLPASPGAAAGRVVFEAADAQELAGSGEPVILVRRETSPDDFAGMVAAEAVVTGRGGVTSHAAVVARGMGKCCVVGAGAIEVNYDQQLFTVDGRQVSKGEWITVDGNTGQILLGEVPTVEPKLDEYFTTLMGWTDEFRRLGVRANADTPEDATLAKQLGAEGIGLCRTEHMFFGEDRIRAMRQMIMAPNAVARSEALAELEPSQAADFEGIFRAMEGYPVTIRLLDPPLHEFLPNHEGTVLRITDLKLQLREASELRQIDRLLEEINERQGILVQIERLAEANPMLGHRGCRLGVVYPEITEMQARAIFTAAARCAQDGVTVLPEVMVPLVAYSTEFEAQERIVREVARKVMGEYGIDFEYQVGTMIELPRATLAAGKIAEHADFFSFGTNDLTQSTIGLSRDDAGRFLPGYVARGLIPADPFQTLDLDGVGELIAMGLQRGRSTKPDLKVGICGEHAGDPASIAFCHDIGLDYVSCSPYRVPVARLAAAQAATVEVSDEHPRVLVRRDA